MTPLHAMQFRPPPPPQVRAARPAKRPSSSDRDYPLVTTGDRCLWHAGGTASKKDDARTRRRRLQLDRRVRPVRWWPLLVGERPKDARQRWARESNGLLRIDEHPYDRDK